MTKTVLVVEDALNIQLFIKELLLEQGYRVVTASNGREALFVARHEKPDVILLDVMMPQMDGFTFMQMYRKEKDTPIIVLTARLDEDDKVLGLEIGADDYVTKPFSPRELIARVRAAIRRASNEVTPADVLRVDDIVLDRTSHRVKVSEQEVMLTPSEYQLLEALMSAPGHAFSRAALLDLLKGDPLDRVERTVDVHIRNLRSKIEANPNQPCYIETVYGIGYRFKPE